MNAQELPFENESYRQMNECRGHWLRETLPALVSEGRLKTALDAGSGLGYFSGLLAREFGFEVTAFDARTENVRLASHPYPDVHFLVDDVEELHTLAGQKWDLVLCFGLLYHLENPFRAIRNLRAATGRYLLAESRVAPASMGAALVEEPATADQALRLVAVVPGEATLAKMLYAAGFAAVYKPRMLPSGPEFSPSLLRRRTRTIMLASADSDDFAPGTPEGFTYVPEPHPGRTGFRGRLVARWLAMARNRFARQTQA